MASSTTLIVDDCDGNGKRDSCGKNNGSNNVCEGFSIPVNESDTESFVEPTESADVFFHTAKTTDRDLEQQEQEQTIVHTTKTPSSTETPQHNTDYFMKEYWDDRFAKEEVKNWLVTFADVKDQLAPFLTRESRILVVGCGNSTFSEELYDAGFRNLWNIDYSEVVIDAMRIKYQESRPDMRWIVSICICTSLS